VQNNRVYSAASVTEVINLLKLHRFSGVLTMRRVSDPRQEEVRISIELGHPTQIRQGTQEEHVSNTTLSWLNSWGAIYFVFHPIEPVLQLPPPQVPPSPVPVLVEPLPPSVRPRLSPSVTQPLPSMVHDQVGGYTIQQANTGTRIPSLPTSHERSGSNGQADYASGQIFDEPIPTLALEMAIPSMTAIGRNYSITQIPRHDRTIFLLINGRRTVADLAQLTKRTLNEVYTSLYRLKRLELIVVEV
jgi:hypothetical protein